MLSAGLEPATLALLAPCSTDWATRAYIKYKKEKKNIVTIIQTKKEINE